MLLPWDRMRMMVRLSGSYNAGTIICIGCVIKACRHFACTLCRSHQWLALAAINRNTIICLYVTCLRSHVMSSCLNFVPGMFLLDNTEYLNILLLPLTCALLYLWYMYGLFLYMVNKCTVQPLVSVELHGAQVEWCLD
uniref:Uncharacterized protein n=1 Tax=Oryza brachyantha TaxID=4533 RepID=J3NAM7_ORYBR